MYVSFVFPSQRPSSSMNSNRMLNFVPFLREHNIRVSETIEYQGLMKEDTTRNSTTDSPYDAATPLYGTGENVARIRIITLKIPPR